MRAGNDHHRIRRVRAAGKRRVHAFDVVRLDAGRQAQAAGQFPGDDLRRVMAEHNVDFVRVRVEVVEQPLGVKRAAGPGDGNEYFHCANHAASVRRKQAARRNRPRSCNRTMEFEDEDENEDD